MATSYRSRERLEMFHDQISPIEVQYMGVPGIPLPCVLAVDAIVNSDRPPLRASLVTYMRDRRSQQGEHLFLFWDWNWVPLTVVHSGFTSGYEGSGPRSLSLALSMINDREIPIQDIFVSHAEFSLIEERKLDSNLIERLRSVPDDPASLHQIVDFDLEQVKEQSFWATRHNPKMAFDFIDPAISKESRTLYPLDSWAAILKAFVVVEERIRLLIGESCGNNLTGEKLIATALRPEKGVLIDKSLPPSEQEGLFLLFKGAYQFVRNSRAHRLVKNSDAQLDIELLYLADLLLRLLPKNPP